LLAHGLRQTTYYYAMIEEVDTWLGLFMEKLERTGADENTLFIFTSDHGEMLGAHGLKGKGVLLEEATKVPLMMSFPGKIPPKTVVQTPVSQIDIVATMTDYLNAKQFDNSQGKSLRRFIEKKSWNQFYDESTVVVELDTRKPVGPNKLSGRLGSSPNFSIRKGKWKLILPKKRDSTCLDMLFDLKADPYEMNNKIGLKGKKAPGYVIGKAEHLKVLLTEWMRRHDGGGKRYYSDPMWNAGEGEGDMREIAARRKWRKVNFWISDNVLAIGRPAEQADGSWRRNEFLYIGRTTPGGQLLVPNISVEGPHKRFFSVTPSRGKVTPGRYLRIKVSFRALGRNTAKGLNAWLVIRNNINGVRRVRLIGY